ncbi:unnamed protein product [Caenorhabditis sp. 36 PRJEB53466]|nr:unnamed protein product [Caenorhabditis sp. 36 PRJEB53466]
MSQNPSMAELIEAERKANIFSKFYTASTRNDHRKRPGRVDPLDEKLSEVQKCLRKYKHAHALCFAAKWHCRKAAESTRKKLPRKQRQVAEFPTENEKSREIYAYYRVIDDKVESNGKYIVVACHVNVHGFHRGDLRFLEVNDQTEVAGFEGYSCIGQLFLGDIVAVTELELAVKGTKPKGTPISVFGVSHETPCTWAVAKMAVLTRTLDHGLVFSVLANGTAIVKGGDEAMNVNAKTMRKGPESDKMYIGEGFMPERIESLVALNYKSDWKYRISAMATKIPVYPKQLGTIYAFEYSKELTEQFGIGWRAFEEFSTSPHNPGEVVQTCAVMGYAAAQTVFNGRFDSRTFQMRNISKNGMIVRFTILNPSAHPTIGRWNTSGRIRISGRLPGGEVPAVIETVIAEKGRLQLAARISRGAPKDLRFCSRMVYLVSQREPSEITMLSNIFVKSMVGESNGKRIIKTLYGGPPIPIITVGARGKFKFGEMELNESQCEYVQMVLDRNPMVIGSSPFGCGKSMTIVTAALEIVKNFNKNRTGYEIQRQQQLLVCQSNYACVNLVHIMAKLKNAGPPVNFLRFVSVNNWMELPDVCRTDHDLPALVGEIFTKWATGALVQHMKKRERYLSHAGKVKIVEYLMAMEEMQTELWTKEAKEIQRQIKEVPRKAKGYKNSIGSLLISFFVLFTPDIVISTVDSVPTLLKSGILKTVINVQVDEASQVPEYTLLSLFIKFPKACFSLIGDTRQLPPYCEEALTGKLKEYGIGNTMERALETDMFPKTTLKYVYRCHPVITNLLSELFYEGELISGVSTTERSEFIMKRSDFWPNPRYPITVIDNQEKGYRMGTSAGNKSEVQIVKQLLQMLTKKHNGYELHARDIGVISFYSAQTSVLTEALRGSGVKCGTVDSFQGTEREVVILCCTNEKLSEFMQLANRLNVAMSRARQATIIIGNVHGLRKAKYWSTILKQVEENGCLVDMKNHEFKKLNPAAKKCTAKSTEKEITEMTEAMAETTLNPAKNGKRRCARRRNSAAAKQE